MLQYGRKAWLLTLALGVGITLLGSPAVAGAVDKHQSEKGPGQKPRLRFNADSSLSTFRVDSPMKGEPSASDPTKLSFQVVAIDPEARNITVCEYLWNTGTWGALTTVPLTPRLN